MIDIKMLKGTGPYNQMKRHIEEVHKDLSPQQRAGKFTALLKRYASNCNVLRPERNRVTLRILDSFIWQDTPEGGAFWEAIDQQNVDPILKEKPLKPDPIVEQPQVVWPEGFIYYNPRLLGGRGAFFNEKGRAEPQGNLVKWGQPELAFEHWTGRLDTIKRPEAPLPGGGRWEGEFTHSAIHDGKRFQFNKTHYKWEGQIKEAIGLVPYHYLKMIDTIARYPDNQPLVLGAPVAAPEAIAPRVEARIPPAPPVIAQAAVEAPKAEPIKHKPVGWWT